MKKIITFLLVCVASTNAASLELKVKTRAENRGLNGIYFELTDLEPFIMYKLQYSEDLKKWTDMVHLGTYEIAMTSPLYRWEQLPPYHCLFRVVAAW